jgi:uncharacterized protein (TIGR02117 family)
MARRRKQRKWQGKRLWRRVALLLAAPVLLYLLAALLGGLVSANRNWSEPEAGITVYVASNGVHTDLILPVAAAGLDWRPLLPTSDVRAAPDGAGWLAFGSGEREVYLNTPRWSDLRLPVAMRALTAGERVVHVEWIADPRFAQRQLRLRPEEYRRLWAAVRAGFRDSRPQRIAHKGYGEADAFYLGIGKANAFDTCNQWVATRLRLAGVEAPLWSPFTLALTSRYRPTD